MGLMASVLCGTAHAGEVVLVLSSGEPEYKQVAAGFSSAFSGEFREINLEANDERQRAVGEELKASKPDLAVVVGDLAAQMANWYLEGVKIVYCDAVWAAKNSIDSENAVGIYHESDPMDQINIMKELFPDKRRVGLLYSSEFARIDKQALQNQAQELGISLEIVGLDSVKKVPAKLRDLMPGVDLLWVFTDPVVFNSLSIQYIVLQSFAMGVPIFCGDNGLAHTGATAAFVPDLEDAGKMAAREGQKVLEGSASAPGSVVYPRGKLVLNQKTASLLKLSFPPSLLGQAVEVIQ